MVIINNGQDVSAAPGVKSTALGLECLGTVASRYLLVEILCAPPRWNVFSITSGT